MNCAVHLNKSKSQWIDLGFHPEVCLTQRYGCGVAGGAVSLWLRLIEVGGILTTRSDQSGGFRFATGLNIFWSHPDRIRYFDNKCFQLLLDRNEFFFSSLNLCYRRLLKRTLKTRNKKMISHFILYVTRSR